MINIDNAAPALAGMELYLDGAMIANYAAADPFFYAAAWDKIRVNFNDLPAVNVGMHNVDVAFDAHPLTYQYDPSEYPQAAAALASMVYSPLVANPDGSGYVDISFTAPYTGTTLPNGRYLISVTNLTDQFGATVDLADVNFDWQYAPAEMTFYINGVANNATVNVSQNPISIVANTSSDLAGLEGVEFRLYYDVDNTGTLTEPDLAWDLTSHLDPATDMVFPYDTYWHMDADEYKFVGELPYSGTAYRGFILRASAITQTRDLYNYEQLIMVTDDVAPVAQPSLFPISQVFDYQNHANNTLNVPVDFVDRDVVRVVVNIYNADGDLVDTMDEAVLDPSVTANVVWNFDTFAPGNYTTDVTAWDFTGNNVTVAGPTIEIINAISMAESEIKIWNRIGINTEDEITGMDFSANPITEYLIVESLITNPATPTNPLNGIAAVSFVGEVVDRATGNVVATFDPVVNVDELQNHNFVGGQIASHLILIDGNVAKVRLAVNNGDIVPLMAAGTDRAFRYSVVFHPEGGFTGIDMPAEKRPFSWFTVDQLAPAVLVANTSAESPVSWAAGHQASFQIAAENVNYDTNTEITAIELQWSMDGATWTQVRPLPVYDAVAGVYNVNNWRIQGGNQFRYLGDDYEGPVQIRAQVTDKVGNIGYAALAADVLVDNKGPETLFTHVSQDISYPATTAIAGNEISIINDQTDVSELRLYVDAAAISADAVLPLMMRQLRPGFLTWEVAEYAGDLNADNMYEFVIPVNKLENGLHRFAVVMNDVRGNLEGDTNSLTQAYDAFLDDTELENATDLFVMVGPKIVFSQIGNAGVVSEIYSMIQDRNGFTGVTTAGLASTLNVNNVGFEYSATGLDPWTAIDVAAPVAGTNDVSVNFTMPALRAPILYLKATAFDAAGRVMSSGMVQLYEDAVATSANVVALVDEYEGKLVIDQTEDLEVQLTYNFNDLEDVARVRIQLIDSNGAVALNMTRNYDELSEAANTFFIPAADLAALADDVYRLEVIVRDFADNVWKLSEDASYAGTYDMLYIDNQAPANLAIASTSHLDEIAPYDATIDFRVNYTDLIAFAANDAFTATFTYQNATDVVSTYTVDEANGWIDFSWTPEADFRQYILDGELDIVVDVNVTATDLLGHSAQLAVADFFTLTYGVPNTTKIMVVTDYVYNVNENPLVPGDEYTDRIHYVDWNLATPQVTEVMGTNQSETDPNVRKSLDLYAYLAHQSDIPAYGVEFYWFDAVANTWNLIGTDLTGNQWPFVHEGFMDQNQREYRMTWDVYGLPTGDYQVKTVSRHMNTQDPSAGASESIITVHLYNGTIVPNFAVNGALNNQVERGETYTLALNETTPFTGDVNVAQGVTYMYRYVDADNGNSPVSEWMHFGDAQGNFITNWIPADYSFDWTVYPYYLYNNSVQIIAFARDQWGTETPLANVMANSVFVEIINTLAPAVNTVSVAWDATVNAGGVAHEAVVTAMINTSSAPQDLATVEFFHRLDGAADYTLFDTQSGWTPAQMNNDLLLVSAPLTYANEAVTVTGDIKVVTTDIFGNTNEDVMALADLPAANFAVTLDGVELTTDLERESTVVLDANPVAAALQSVEYFWAETPVAPAAPAWNAIDLVNADPWTLQWDVPQNWTFGASYLLKAEVTDLAGNSFSHARSFVITDHTTDIVINTVAGIVPTSIGIIEPRLHGDNIPVAVTVNDPAIPRVEYMIRGVQDAAWTSVAFENVVNNPVTHVFDALTDLASGEYYIGVRASQARTRLYPVIADSVLITVDNDIAVTVNSSIPETNGFFNGENFVVNFSVASDDEILENNVALEYNTANEPTWMPANNATLTTANGIDYVATFANVNVPVDGYYNFRIIVQDSAVPAANVIELDVAQNILVDSGIPIVAMVSINGETDLTLPVDIELGTQASIVASAYDIAGGQIHLIASGIERVEFISDGAVIGEVATGVRNREAYTFVWDTNGFEINTVHQIQAVAYDFAGNNAGTAIYNVNIVAPVQLQAYAMITAMEFDNETSNNDVIYAVVKDWPNTGNAAVTFEYFDGTDWSQFATAVNQGAYYSANFNAETMTAATALRAVVNGNYDAMMPQLAVSYNAAEAGFVVVDPQITADIFYKDELHVEETLSGTPIVTAIHRTVPAQPVPVHMNDIYMLNGHQGTDIEIPGAGTHTFWAAVLDNNNNVQLTKTELVTVNQGTASENGISFNVPAGGYGYFEDVEFPMPVEDGFTALSPQHAFFAKDNLGNLVNSDLTIAITAPAAQGTLVAMTYDAATGTWSAPIAVIDNENGTVTVPGVPSGTIVSVFQYTGVGINVMFSSMDPEHTVGANHWTNDAPELQFFVYEGMDADGYIIPDAVTNVTMYLDDVVVIPTAGFNPATGLVTYAAAGLDAGAHTIRLVVDQNGFTAAAEQAFNVDITEPVITATGTQITNTVRAITATIADTETGIMDVLLTIDGIIDVPMSSMTVAGNTYTYNITDEDLFTLGYDWNHTLELSASWTAMNNLEMAAAHVNVNYTVNIDGPGIVFTGFENGWWINPTQNTPLTFNVIAPAGREIQDNLMITLEELINDPVNGNYENLIQEMELAPVSVAGNVYSYSVNFGYSVAPNAHAVRLTVSACDSYCVQAESQQTYGIDYLAPIVWAVSPVGAPIDPEAFPVTYESAVIPYGTPVTIAVGFQDMQGFATQETGEWYYVPADDTWHHEYLVYYTGASGLNLDEVVVTLDGTALNGTVSGGAFTAPQNDLAPGLHTVVATVADNAGNVGTMSYSFTVTGGAPSITFTGLNGDANNFWINSTNNNVLGFTVQTQGNVAVDTVVANIYAEPSNIIIQGPITPAATGNAYSINLLGGIVPAGSFAVRLEVTVSTVLGTIAVSNQTYGIDNDAPMITLTSPAEASVFAQNALVNILATISDQIATKGGMLGSARNINSNRAGSGINDVQLKVFTPSGIDLMAEVDVPVAQVIAESISGEQTSELGTYTIVLIATDGANNQSMVNRTFMVAPATGPAVSFTEFNNGWLNANQINNLQFNVTGQGISSVSASVYANPSEALLMGPLAVNPSNGVYTVGVNGNMIPADQTSIRLEVTVNDQYGNETVANYYYNIDKMAPVVTILNPAEGAEITRVDETTKVVIEAQFSDMMPGKKAASGSGIASSRLVVIGPDGTQIGDAVVTGAGITETSHQLNNLAIGAYVARVTVIDNAGNQAVASVNFTVVDVPAPPVALEITDAHAYPNPASAETGARFVVSVTNTSTVSVRIYDFAGREVRSMNYAGKTNGKSTIEIVFDGRNNDGVKLARGTYFARVMANDGMKTVEKVVKIAIRK
ncbi:MAG TPA: Ig-like domain repeat protein [Candidatus Cloacimonadota bacterium]|nr:Ig-like domain repeat protein [Candidatus Cloacimonadota bacterium]